MPRKKSLQREIALPNDDERWAEALEAWDRRSERDEARTAVDIFEELADDYEEEPLAWAWVARGYYWLGDSIREKADRRENFGEGYEAAKTGLKLDRASVPLNFWGGCCLAQYVKDSNPLAQATQLPALMGMLKVVHQSQPDYFYKGLSRMLSIAMAHAPGLAAKALGALGLKVTMDGLIADLEGAIREHPGCIANYVTLAEVWRGLKDMNKAKAALEAGIKIKPSAEPTLEPENRLDLERLQRRLREW